MWDVVILSVHIYSVLLNTRSDSLPFSSRLMPGQMSMLHPFNFMLDQIWSARMQLSQSQDKFPILCSDLAQQTCGCMLAPDSDRVNTVQ